MRRALLASVTGTALMGLMVPAMAGILSTPATCPGACTGFSGTIGVGTATDITNKIGTSHGRHTDHGHGRRAVRY